MHVQPNILAVEDAARLSMSCYSCICRQMQGETLRPTGGRPGHRPATIPEILPSFRLGDDDRQDAATPLSTASKMSKLRNGRPARPLIHSERRARETMNGTCCSPSPP